jgi:lysophospholipase L1-like esterase
MRKQLIKFFLGFLLTAAGMYGHAQPFANEIRDFRKQDSIRYPPRGAILFVGSSSFTKWTDLQDYFPGFPVINRGFGGSSLPDLIRYADEIIFPYQPRQVVIYCGENDLAASDTVSATTVSGRFVSLFSMIREKMPGENIVFISIKPSPSRASQRPRQIGANEKIKAFLARQANTSYVDVCPLMLNADGKPMPAIFVSDSLHMNAKGYAIWQKAILPHLKK